MIDYTYVKTPKIIGDANTNKDKEKFIFVEEKVLGKEIKFNFI
jgi:hypothetical protein